MSARNMDQVVLHDLFLAQVPKTPNAIAVVDGNIELTYQQLDEVTDRLAIQLVEEYGVIPDAVVGILMPRSVQYVIALVAVLKAGGAYMPLELVYPKALLERAIVQTQTKVVLTTEMYESRVEGQPTIVLSLEAPFVAYTTNLSYPPPHYQHPHADHLAFCVMSSGTTGAPKGICQTHRAAIHSYEDRLNRFPYHRNREGLYEDRIGAGVFFVWELFRPLCRGATCVVIPDHVLFDPEAVTKFVQSYAITRILFTPSLMQLIHDTLDDATIQSRFANLRYLWFCGEVVSTDLALATTKVLPNVELMNLYSISECHDVSIGDLKRELDLSRKYATCGKQIPGVEFYIVNLESPEMALVPVGETGEVYVGGPVVGRGYLNMPDKTAERFVPNPFSTDPNFSRLYRTGDLGRLLPNGHLEVMGRCDFMVKIRGYSVVLGAIETALAKHPKLSSAVVLAVGSEGSKDKKLVAYVVPTNWHDAPSASSVRAFLKDHVPPYAIPSMFCVIDALPVAATAAGKLDRKKLPPHESAPRLRAFSEDLTHDQQQHHQQQQPSQGQRLAPQNFTEQAILDIWAELLELPPEELSATDSFFEVGGHSLLATKLVGLVNTKFGLEPDGLNIIQVMEDPTIRGMADLVLQKQQGGSDTTTRSTTKVVDLITEGSSLDPSIYPFPTRKGDTMSRFRLEASALMSPRVVFLTGATGYLGAHILAELLQTGVTVLALARANSNDAAKDRIVKTLQKYNLLDGLVKTTSKPGNQENQSPQLQEEGDDDDERLVDTKLVAVAGDFSKPLLGMDNMQFKSLALEIDSIIHCGAEVNLMKPYGSLKEPNVLGTQEILRLATTNGFVKTKVKPVHYISTNGIFPVDMSAYPEHPICVKEDVVLEEFAPHLKEGYAMTKWVAEKLCMIAEERGLPISVLRPGNMAGSSSTGVQNSDDFNYLFLQGIIATGCAPLQDTNYFLDMTPVDYAAKAVVHLAVHAPHKAMGQRFHLQTPQKPMALQEIVDLLRQSGYTVEAVSREEFVQRLSQDSRTVQLASGWPTFEPYLTASAWLQYGCDNLQFACGDVISCPTVDATLLAKWFPKNSTATTTDNLTPVQQQ